jgi:hypothetical protein
VEPPKSRYLTVMAPTARARSLLQPILLAAAWLLFAWSWATVLGETSAETMRASAILVGLAFVSVVAVTWWWIAHNLRIYRRKGPRKSVPTVQRDFSTDFLGRVLPDDLGLLQRAPLLVVVSRGERKRFLVGDGGTDPFHVDPGDPTP